VEGGGGGRSIVEISMCGDCVICKCISRAGTGRVSIVSFAYLQNSRRREFREREVTEMREFRES